MSLPTSAPIPPPVHPESAVRRRRRQRIIVPSTSGEKAAFLEELAYLCEPSLTFFLRSILFGLVIGMAALMDSAPIFFLALISAPFMGPVIGISLSSVVNSRRFFLQTLGAALAGCLFVFLGGAGSGWISNHLIGSLPSRYLLNLHTAYTWQDFFVVTLGSILCTLMIVRKRTQPIISSLALVYELYFPLGIAGFGLTVHLPEIFSDGLIVFLVYFSWALIVSAATFAIQGLRPGMVLGFTLGTSLVLMGIAALIAVNGAGTTAIPLEITPSAPAPLPATTSPKPQQSATAKASAAVEATAADNSIPTATLSPTNTLVPSSTPTQTVSPQPTPVWAKIFASEGGGAIIRQDPNYTAAVVKSVVNGTLVQILPEVSKQENVTWVKVRTLDGLVGWVVQMLLVTATPAPN